MMPEVLKGISRKKQNRLNRKAMIERTEEFLRRFEHINLTNGRPYEKSASSTTFKKFWLKRFFKTSTSRNGSCDSKSSCVTTKSSRLSSSTEDEAQTESDFFTSERESAGGIEADIEDFQESFSNRPKHPSLIEYYIRRRPGRNASLRNYALQDMDNDVFLNQDCNHNLNLHLSSSKINPQNRKRIRTSASSRTSERSKSSRTLDLSTEDVFYSDPLHDNARILSSSDRLRIVSNVSQHKLRSDPTSVSSLNSKNSIILDNDSDNGKTNGPIFVDKIPARNYELVFDDEYSHFRFKVDHFESMVLGSFDEGTIGDIEDCLDSDFPSSPMLKSYYGMNRYFERFYS